MHSRLSARLASCPPWPVPELPAVFLADLGDSNLAKALEMPVRLISWAHTYMNETPQTPCSVQEQRGALQSNTTPATQRGRTQQTRAPLHVFDEKQLGFVPAAFLAPLRRLVLPLAQRSQHGPGIAQKGTQ